MTVEGKGVLGAKPKMTGKKARAVTGTLKTPIYKKAEIVESGSEVTVSFEGGYRAEIFADGMNADRDATDYTRTVQTLEGGKPVTVKLAPGGGWTARLEPAKRFGLF
jgi:hypothetical protein